MKYLREYISGIIYEVNSEIENVTKLRIFDFDDTLAATKEVTYIRDKKTSNIINALATQEELDNYVKNEDEYLDYNEFETVTEPEEITQITDILRDVVRAEEADPERIIMVLTARPQLAERDIRAFLQDIGINDTYINVKGTAPEGAEGKVKEIERLLALYTSVNDVQFFDDSSANISAVSKLANKKMYKDRIEFRIRKIIRKKGGEIGVKTVKEVYKRNIGKK